MPKSHTLARLVQPSLEPVSREELKGQLQLPPSHNCQAIELDRAISSARIQFEQLADRAILRQTWRYGLTYDAPAFIALHYPPLVSVNSFTYLDTQHITRTISSDLYTVVTEGFPGAVVRQRRREWPTDVAVDYPYPYSITYECGWSLREEVPQDIRLAILQLAAYYYLHRETAAPGQLHQLPHAYASIVSQHRVFYP